MNAPIEPTSAAPSRRPVVPVAAVLIALPLLLAAAMLVGSLVGPGGWSRPGALSYDIWAFRLGRLTAAAIVGVALAVSGVALQSLLRNPLASPYVLGLSSGAGVGVLAGMALLQVRIGSLWANTPLLAAGGAMGTMLVVYLVAQRRGRLDPYSLLLTGVIVSAFNGAIMLFINLYVSPNVVVDYVHWAMGMVPEGPNRYLLASTAALTGLGWLFLFFQSIAFNVQSLGDDVATSAGVNVAWLRLGTFFTASLMTAAAVALAGPIGFVGLIIPHICRLIVGPDHRLLVIVSGFAGALFLVLADTFCRSTVFLFGGELPVGILTAFCGGPFFLYLLRSRLREMAS